MLWIKVSNSSVLNKYDQLKMKLVKLLQPSNLVMILSCIKKI